MSITKPRSGITFNRRPNAPCATPGCSGLRHPTNFSAYCPSCRARIGRYGTANPSECRRISGSDWHPHRKIAKDFLTRRRDTPQVRAACRIVATLLQAANVKTTTTTKALRYQVQQGLRPMEVLERTLVVYLLHRAQPHLITSGARLKCELGKAIVQAYPLAMKYRDRVTGKQTGTAQTSGRVRREVGDWAIDNLFQFFANCERAINSIEEKHARDRKLIKEEFAV